MNQRTSISDYRAQLRFCGIFGVVTFAIALLGAAPAAAAACENLAGFALPNAQIHSTQMVAAGAFVQPGGGGRAGRGEGANPFAKLPAFCRVTATLTPTRDSDIKIEVWLPARDGMGNSKLPVFDEGTSRIG